jgi:hypothetical protein
VEESEGNGGSPSRLLGDLPSLGPGMGGGGGGGGGGGMMRVSPPKGNGGGGGGGGSRHGPQVRKRRRGEKEETPHVLRACVCVQYMVVCVVVSLSACVYIVSEHCCLMSQA